MACGFSTAAFRLTVYERSFASTPTLLTVTNASTVEDRTSPRCEKVDPRADDRLHYLFEFLPEFPGILRRLPGPRLVKALKELLDLRAEGRERLRTGQLRPRRYASKQQRCLLAGHRLTLKPLAGRIRGSANYSVEPETEVQELRRAAGS